MVNLAPPAPLDPQTPLAPASLYDDVAKKYGVSSSYIGRDIGIESGGNANAHNPSGADGLGQFMPKTWQQYEPGKDTHDKAAQIDAIAHFAHDNMKALTPALGRAPTDGELYLAHQQGAGGAIKLLMHPDIPAGQLVSPAAIRQNGGNPNAPAGAFTAMWLKRFDHEQAKNVSMAGAQDSLAPSASLGGGAPQAQPEAPGGEKPAAVASADSPAAHVEIAGPNATALEVPSVYALYQDLLSRGKSG